MSLTADRATAARTGLFLAAPVKGAAIIFAGALAAIDTNGRSVPASNDPTLKVIGRSRDRYDNSAGADGDLMAEIERGIFRFDNSAAGDAIALANVGEDCYAVSDSQVALTSNGGTRPRAGTIVDVDALGVWIDTRDAKPARKVYASRVATDLVAADAAEYSVVAPVAGRITAIRSVLDGHVIAGADATLTGKINGVAITTGVITHPLAGSAVGERKLVNPTANNAVSAGDRISFLVGGGNTNNVAQAAIAVEITL